MAQDVTADSTIKSQPVESNATTSTLPKNQATAPKSLKATTKAAAASGDVTTVQVTGSRLRSGNTTTHVVVITAEDIKERGVTSVEELMRTIPQNVNTIGAITNERTRGPLSSGNAPVSALGSLGVSAANLGGMGAGKTLILVNGRRVAGAAGIQDGFANLNGIPLSAIDRVEITTEGASAIYGADAIGGVINFILKRNFIGTTLTAQHEYSANGADNSRVSLYSGYSWGSGSLSGTLDYSERKPINNYKSGYTTENYSSYFNNDPSYDYRSFTRGIQPGVIDLPTYMYNPATYQFSVIDGGLTLPAGFTGKPTIADFISVTADQKRDVVAEYAGPESKSVSLTLNFEQKITDKLSFFATGLFNRTANSQAQSYATGAGISMAPGQYYNPFPAKYFNGYSLSTTAYYYPGNEIATGLLPPSTISNVSKSWNLNAGLTYDFSSETRLEFIYTASASDTQASSWQFGSLVGFIAAPTSPNGVACYNFALANNRYSGAQKATYQAAFNAQCLALTSSDPSVAFDPFKSTANGPGASSSVFYYHDQSETRQSTLQTGELRLIGNLFALPAGKINYAVGGEYSSNSVTSPEVAVFTAGKQGRDHYAWFVETNIPVFGKDFNFPMARQLNFNLAARRDTYNTRGPVGTVGGVPIDSGGQLIYGKNTFSSTSPSFGVRWSPVTTVTLRSHWTKGFQAPPYSDLFSLTGTYNSVTYIYNDPLYQCTTDCAARNGATSYYIVPSVTAPNPNLKPQSSTQSTLGLNWRPDGILQNLIFDASYSDTKIRNEYANRSDLLSVMAATDIYRIAEFYPRDANGKIIAAQNKIFNIAGSEYASVVYELSYLWDTPVGTFYPKVTYLNNLKAERKIYDNSTPISTLGTVEGADRYKITGSVEWHKKNYGATLWAYYTPQYINDYVVYEYAGVISNPTYAKTVKSMTTINLTAYWRISNALRLNFSGRNIFAAHPPFTVVQNRPYDTARYDAAGRTVSLQLEYTF